ncbi:MAG: hypothetical protein MJ245_01690 [Clostridia bacterium]|nr:hypothetical protein [Clostridia bacterium]
MKKDNPNFKIEKITYDEYLQFENVYNHLIKKDIFEKYQSREKAPMQFFKMRVDFDIIYFQVANSTLAFINKDIYEYDFKTIIKIFETITSLGLNQYICFYTPFKGSNAGKTEDYIDNIKNKEKFISKYEKYFKKQEYRVVNKIELVGDNESLKEKIICKDKNKQIICSDEEKNINIIFKIVEDELVLEELPYERIMKESENLAEFEKYFEFVEKTILCLNQKYKNIYTYTKIDIDYKKYFKNIKYNKEKIIYQYYI